MADKDITVDGNLTNVTSPSGNDRFMIVDNAATALKDITWSVIRSAIWDYLTSLTAKTTLTGADQFSIADSAASNVAKKITWTNVLAEIVSQFTAASTTAAGKVELAITSEIDTASDDTRAMPPGQFRTSKFATQRIRGTLASPGTYYTTNGAVLPMFRADSALTITRIHIFGNDSTPTTELAGDLKFADDQFTGSLANATVIDVCDTTSGAFTATSSFDDATVPSGKYIYFQFDSAPHADWLRVTFEVYFTYD